MSQITSVHARELATVAGVFAELAAAYAQGPQRHNVRERGVVPQAAVSLSC
jgi:hypothetical protein